MDSVDNGDHLNADGSDYCATINVMQISNTDRRVYDEKQFCFVTMALPNYLDTGLISTHRNKKL